MKTIYLVRHAKSCWKNELSDIKRPINSRGVRDSNLVSNHLKNNSLVVDKILCSTANRTKLTSEIFIKNLSLAHVGIDFLEELYDFSGESLLKVISTIDNRIDNVLIFGHNYALTNFVNKFGDIFIENVTTSGFVKINFEIDTWENLCKGKTKKILFPKHLK